jgi:hypothetical protein
MAFSWQWVVVRSAFHGNWTALFCSGDHFSRPPEIDGGQYVFPASTGYDGQFYQIVAHDPLFRHGYAAFIDAPRLRYRRILMPALAYLLAAGASQRIDAAYISVCLFFVGLGSFCLAQLALENGRQPLWGLLFLFTPATLMGIERMTIDISLSALCLLCLLLSRKQHWLLLWCALAAAVLSRETGLLVLAGVVFWLGKRKRFALAAVLTSSLLPAVAWYGFVQIHTGGDYSTSGFRLFPILDAFKAPLAPDVLGFWFRIATGIAAIGMLAAAVQGVYTALKNRLEDLAAILCFFFAAFVIVFPAGAVWSDADGFPRIYSPLLLYLVTATWQSGFTLALASFALAGCPLYLQLGGHLVWSVMGR